jgi:hypothetical protein
MAWLTLNSKNCELALIRPEGGLVEDSVPERQLRDVRLKMARLTLDSCRRKRDRDKASTITIEGLVESRVRHSAYYVGICISIVVGSIVYNIATFHPYLYLYIHIYQIIIRDRTDEQLSNKRQANAGIEIEDPRIGTPQANLVYTLPCFNWYPFHFGFHFGHWALGIKWSSLD